MITSSQKPKDPIYIIIFFNVASKKEAKFKDFKKFLGESVKKWPRIKKKKIPLNLYF